MNIQATSGGGKLEVRLYKRTELTNNFEIDGNALLFSPMRDIALAFGFDVIQEENKVLYGLFADSNGHHVPRSKEGFFRVRLG